MALLVTGAAGFIGSNLARHLVRGLPGERIVSLDALTFAGNAANLADLEGAPNHRFVHGDITDRPLLERLFAEESIRGVFHLAAETHVDRSIIEPATFLRANITGTFTLLEAARDAWLGAGKPGGRFLHVSTDEVYGSIAPDAPAATEANRYAPNNPYSASKAASDHLVRAWHVTYGLETVTTNCANNFGPFQFPEKLVPVIIDNAVAARPLPVYGDGGNVRDWLYVRDHCAALARVFEAGRPGETYNIAGQAELTNLEVVGTICDVLDEMLGAPAEGPRRRLLTFVKDRPGHDRRYALDDSKLRRELGWAPAHDFPAALRETIAWYLANAAWVEACKSGAYRDYMRANYASRDAGK